GWNEVDMNCCNLPSTPWVGSTELRTAPDTATTMVRFWLAVKPPPVAVTWREDRKSTRLNSSHVAISYAVFCLKKKKFSTMLWFMELWSLLIYSPIAHKI